MTSSYNGERLRQCHVMQNENLSVRVSDEFMEPPSMAGNGGRAPSPPQTAR